MSTKQRYTRRIPARDLAIPKQGYYPHKLLPKKKPNVMTVDELERELREKKQRKRGPRVRGRKAPA
jgi:hypothetical protein